MAKGNRHSTCRHPKRASEHHRSSSKPAPLSSRSNSASNTPGPQRSRSRSHNQNIDFLSRPYAFVRPTETEAPYKGVPSCSNLPPTWNRIHDRFIAYLATHTRLTSQGEKPDNEMALERYSLLEIATLLWGRFPALRDWSSGPIRPSVIERRLEYLDLCHNDYFRIPYCFYNLESWGKNI